MKAIVYRKYGPPTVLKIEEIDKPIPKSNEVLIKVYATSVTQGDWRLRKAKPFMARLYNGILKPRRVKTLGFELSGVVVELGSAVTTYNVGDEVFAFTGFGFGAYAQYRCLPVDGDYKTGLLARKPNNMTFEEAAVVPGGCLTAFSHFKKVELGINSRILIYGASGSVGTYFLQLASNSKAHVFAVCSTGNVELVKSLGADRVIDYNHVNFRDEDYKYDLIFDAVNKLKASSCKNNLTKNGVYISVTSKTTVDDFDLNKILDMIEANKIKSVVDLTFLSNDIVRAHEYVESGHKKGNVSIIMDL